jgi:hypothetical protein
MRFVLLYFVFSFVLSAHSQGLYETTCSKNMFGDAVCETAETPLGQLRRENSIGAGNSVNDLSNTIDAMRRRQQEDEKRQFQSQADYSCVLSGSKGFNPSTGQCYGGVQQNSVDTMRETGEMLIDSAVDHAANAVNAKDLSQQQRFLLKKCMKSNIQVTPHKAALDTQVHMNYLLGANGDKELIKRIGSPRWYEKVLEVDMFCRSTLKMPFIDRAKYQYK